MFYVFGLSLFFLFTFLKTCSSQGETGQKSAGPYEVKITSIIPCDLRNDTVQMGFYNTRMSKYNRTHTCINGLYHYPYGLTDDMQETWEVFSKGSTGGFKRFLTFTNKKACSDKKRLFPRWFRLMNLQKTPCPIPPGNYTFDCFNLTGLRFGKAKVMTYGEYKVKVNFFYNKENIGCTDFKGEVIPRLINK